AVLGRLGHDKAIDESTANHTMTVLLKLIHTALKNSTVLEDVFLAVSALTHGRLNVSLSHSLRLNVNNSFGGIIYRILRTI
ncbi:hypothetical protein HK096_001557, partial [Nowakowskiella sp. JEL0078]